MFDAYTAKVSLAAIGGYAALLSTLDLVLKVLVGAVTLGFICHQWWRFHKNRPR